MPTLQSTSTSPGRCEYAPPGCVWSIGKFLTLLLAFFLAFVAGGVIARLDQETLSSLTYGWADKVLPRKELARPDLNNEVLSRMAEFQAEVSAALDAVRRDVERFGSRVSSPAAPSGGSEPGSPAAPKTDYSKYRINP